MTFYFYPTTFHNKKYTFTQLHFQEATLLLLLLLKYFSNRYELNSDQFSAGILHWELNSDQFSAGILTGS